MKNIEDENRQSMFFTGEERGKRKEERGWDGMGDEWRGEEKRKSREGGLTREDEREEKKEGGRILYQKPGPSDSQLGKVAL